MISSIKKIGESLMFNVVKRIVKVKLDAILEKRGYEITKKSGFSLSYIDAHETISAAKREGLSLSEYLEKIWNQQGDSQKVIDQMAAFGAFKRSNLIVVEIGTGTGIYLEKVFHQCKPKKYESYEIDRAWANYLSSKYPIVSHNADGISLRHTPSRSIDLVHAHGVFVYLSFLTAYRYWMEIWRVTKEGSFVVFDIISEDCLDQITVNKWLNSVHDYLRFLSKNFVISLFNNQGFSLISTFFTRYGEGRSEYLVFIRDSCEYDGDITNMDFPT
jgi:hypothetical protein